MRGVREPPCSARLTVMSASSETSVVMQGITHGAVDYLLKPVRIEELRNIWQHVVRRRGDASLHLNEDLMTESGETSRKRKEVSSSDGGKNGNDEKGGQKKARVVWSVELHQQFVNAVHQLGVDKAVPKRILELMGVEGLTRENVASHLQKYRLYLKRLQNHEQQQRQQEHHHPHGMPASSAASSSQPNLPPQASADPPNAPTHQEVIQAAQVFSGVPSATNGVMPSYAAPGQVRGAAEASLSPLCSVQVNEKIRFWSILLQGHPQQQHQHQEQCRRVTEQERLQPAGPLPTCSQSQAMGAAKQATTDKVDGHSSTSGYEQVVPNQPHPGAESWHGGQLPLGEGSEPFPFAETGNEQAADVNHDSSDVLALLGGPLEDQEQQLLAPMADPVLDSIGASGAQATKDEDGEKGGYEWPKPAEHIEDVLHDILGADP